MIFCQEAAKAGPLLSQQSPKSLWEKKIHGVVKIGAYEGGKLISYGTGLFISPNGHLITNLHVLQYLFIPPFQLEILLYSGERLSEVEIIHCSDQRKIDLCLLKAPMKPKAWFELSPEMPSLGQNVFKIGHGQENDFHLTLGVTLERERNIPFLLDYHYSENREVEFIEVSAPLYPGDSGGPIFDSYGKLMGMTTLRIQGPKQVSPLGRGMGISTREIYHYVKHWEKQKGPLTGTRFSLLTNEKIKNLQEKDRLLEEPPDHLLLVKSLSFKQLDELKRRERVVVIDVRDPFSYQMGHVPGALNIYYEEKSRKHPDFLMAQDKFSLDQLKKYVGPQDAVLFYAQGRRSWESYKAAKVARVQGNYEKIYWVKGGHDEWTSLAGQP